MAMGGTDCRGADDRGAYREYHHVRGNRAHRVYRGKMGSSSLVNKGETRRVFVLHNPPLGRKPHEEILCTNEQNGILYMFTFA